MYHSGQTEDLHTVLEYGLNHGIYEDAALIGFSMGGNQVLKYLGENPVKVPAKVKHAIAISVPCDLASSAEKLCSGANFIYNRYFLRSLKNKIRLKHKQYPELYPLNKLSSIRNIVDFDNAYTAPVNNFKDAHDYYEKSSCKQFLKNISVPSLIINSEDDPFLTPECFPVDEAAANQNLSLLMPKYGGHVGFADLPMEKQLWSEDRTIRFLNT